VIQVDLVRRLYLPFQDNLLLLVEARRISLHVHPTKKLILAIQVKLKKSVGLTFLSYLMRKRGQVPAACLLGNSAKLST